MALPRRDDSPFCLLFLYADTWRPIPLRSDLAPASPCFLDTWTFFDSWDIPPNIIPLLSATKWAECAFFLLLSTCFAMFITVALGAQHILGFLLFQPWPDRDEGHGVVSRHTTAQMLLGGRKGKEDTLIFRLSCRCGISYAWAAGIWRAHSLLMRFDDERAKETIDGKGDLAFFLFCLALFFSLSCITIAMRERIGSIDFDLIITH